MVFLVYSKRTEDNCFKKFIISHIVWPLRKSRYNFTIHEKFPVFNTHIARHRCCERGRRGQRNSGCLVTKRTAFAGYLVKDTITQVWMIVEVAVYFAVVDDGSTIAAQDLATCVDVLAWWLKKSYPMGKLLACSVVKLIKNLSQLCISMQAYVVK